MTLSRSTSLGFSAWTEVPSSSLQPMASLLVIRAVITYGYYNLALILVLLVYIGYLAHSGRHIDSVLLTKPAKLLFRQTYGLHVLVEFTVFVMRIILNRYKTKLNYCHINIFFLILRTAQGSRLPDLNAYLLSTGKIIETSKSIFLPYITKYPSFPNIYLSKSFPAENNPHPQQFSLISPTWITQSAPACVSSFSYPSFALQTSREPEYFRIHNRFFFSIIITYSRKILCNSVKKLCQINCVILW